MPITRKEEKVVNADVSSLLATKTISLDKTYDLTPLFEEQKRDHSSQNKDELIDLTPLFEKQVKNDYKNKDELIDLTPLFEKQVKNDSKDKDELIDLTPLFEKQVKNDSKNKDELIDLTPLFEKQVKNGSKNKDELIDLTPLFEKQVKNDSKDKDELFDLTPLFEKQVKNDSKNKGKTSFDLTKYFESDREEQSQDEGRTFDLTPFFVSGQEEPSQDEESTNGEPRTDSMQTDIVKTYDHEIPQNTQAYRLFPDKIMADMMGECRCQPQCADVLLQDDKILYKTQQFRSEYYTISQGNKRSTYLLRLIRDSLCIENKNRMHNFQGKKLCQKKWTDLLGISMATYYRILSFIKDGYIVVDMFKKNLCHNYRGLAAVAYIENFLESHGDPSPERETILLPDCINIKYIYDEYMSIPGVHVKKRWFYRLFEDNFSKCVSFAKTKNINPCDICMKVKMVMHKLTSATDREQLKEDLKIHLERQRAERQDYYRKKTQAKLKPNEFLSLIVDGMDQSKTNIPHFKGWTRPKCGSAALKTHITGCLVHEKNLHLYTDLLQWPHDPNMTITCILDAICSSAVSLPPTLYIQCDNCGRENKNKYVIGFLGYLCLAGYVKEAHLSFLIKGHTHEDIDQRFSKISHRLRAINALTLPELQKELDASFQEKPRAEILHCVWDVKQWIDNSLCDISAHSYQHQFWVYCDRPNHVAFKYRRFSTDKWQPESDEQLELFDLNIDGDHVLPRGVPKYVTPTYENGRMEGVKVAIQKLKNFLSYDQFKWWTDFLDDPNKYVHQQKRWPLLRLQKVHQVVDIPEQIQENNQPSCINSMVAAESVLREVTTKKRKKKVADKNKR